MTKKSWRIVLVGAVLALGIGLGATRLLGGASQDSQNAATKPTPAADALTDSQRFMVPVSLSQAKQGPEDALVTITIWSDLVGAESKRATTLLDQIRKQHGDQVRLSFRHFLPPGQMQTMEVHEFAQIAEEHGGKLWELVALLPQETQAPGLPEFERLAGRLGLDWTAVKSALEGNKYRRTIGTDYLFAGKFGVKEAPALFVNGRRLIGELALPRLQALVAQELAHAEKLVASGVPRDQVYAEVIKDGVWLDKTGEVVAASH